MNKEELLVAFLLWLKSVKDIHLHILQQYGDECPATYDEPEELASEFLEYLTTANEENEGGI